MKMLKQKAAGLFVYQKFRNRKFDNKSFSLAFKNSGSFLVLMPEDDNDFQLAVKVLVYLEKAKKEIFVLTNDYRVSLLPFQFRGTAISHGIKDINKIDLPTRGMISKLFKNKFDALIDLNRKDQLFYIYISGIVNAGVSIGFTKNFADKVYNLQIANIEINPKISYENLLSCLKLL
jgi:hypothetical protein